MYRTGRGHEHTIKSERAGPRRYVRHRADAAGERHPIRWDSRDRSDGAARTRDAHDPTAARVRPLQAVLARGDLALRLARARLVLEQLCLRRAYRHSL